MNKYTVQLRMLDDTILECYMYGDNETDMLYRISCYMHDKKGVDLEDTDGDNIVINFGLVKWAYIKHNR